MRYQSFVRLAVVVVLSMAGAASAQDDAYPQRYISDLLEAVQTPKRVDLAGMRPGSVIKFDWAEHRIVVYKRTDADLARLRANPVAEPPDKAQVRRQISAFYKTTASAAWTKVLLMFQPTLEQKPLRSLDERFFVFDGSSPYSGRLIRLWQQGAREEVVFLDPYSGARFDAAGRVVVRPDEDDATSPALNLYLPPHRLDGTTLVMGLKDAAQRARRMTLEPPTGYGAMSPAARLRTAACFNDLDQVKRAVAAGADVNASSADRPSPLDCAVLGGSDAIVMFLLERGATPTDKTARVARYLGRDELAATLRRHLK